MKKTSFNTGFISSTIQKIKSAIDEVYHFVVPREKRIAVNIEPEDDPTLDYDVDISQDDSGFLGEDEGSGEG